MSKSSDSVGSPHRAVFLLLMALASALLTACCHQCPDSRSPADVEGWERELRERVELKIDYGASITVKRDVHDVLVDVPAERYAAAFHQVMIDPQRRFGLIKVDRLRENVGKPFSQGEKFQGRYEVDAAIQARLRGKVKDWFGDIADSAVVQDWFCAIENRSTSDYGLISQLEMQPPPGKPYVLQYRYLSGSPIAGSSTFVVSDERDPEVLARHGVAQASRLRQIFEYQEKNASFASFFTKGGLRLHNQVVYSQALQAAEVAQGRVLETDIPAEYQQVP